MVQRAEMTLHFRRVARWWLIGGVAFGTLHVVLGVCSICLAAAVASNFQIFSVPGHEKLALEKLLNVTFAGLVTLFSAKEAAQRHLKAHRQLRGALEKYDSEPAFTVHDVSQAYDEGASILDQSPIPAKKLG